MGLMRAAGLHDALAGDRAVPRPSARPLNIAHRGASRKAPENTVAAVRRALGHGADRVEVDVQRTRDGALVVMHDTDVVRTTDARRVLPHRGPWRVGELALEEIRRLDAGAWKGRRWAGEPVPTLDEVLAVLHGTGVGLQLELKAPWLYPGVVADLAGALERGVDVDVVVQSFDLPAMKELKTRLPGQRVGLLGWAPVAHLRALGSWADQLNPHYRAADARYVDAVHEAGMQCMVWTVDRPKAMRRALRAGTDGVITNRPRRFGSVLEEPASRREVAAR